MHYDCPAGLEDDQNWNALGRKEDQQNTDAQYDLCSGSLITNKGRRKMKEQEI